MNAKKDIQQQAFQENPWNVYLSGEIHSDWREQIKEVLNTYQVPVQFSEPNKGHSDSDDCGSILLGSESDSFWHDHKGAGLNSIRRRKLIQEADIVVVRFGKQSFQGGWGSIELSKLRLLHKAFQHRNQGKRDLR